MCKHGSLVEANSSLFEFNHFSLRLVRGRYPAYQGRVKMPLFQHEAYRRAVNRVGELQVALGVENVECFCSGIAEIKLFGLGINLYQRRQWNLKAVIRIDYGEAL